MRLDGSGLGWNSFVNDFPDDQWNSDDSSDSWQLIPSSLDDWQLDQVAVPDNQADAVTDNTTCLLTFQRVQAGKLHKQNPACLRQ